MSLVYFARFNADGRYTHVGTAPPDSPTLEEPDVYVGEVDPVVQYHGPRGPEPFPPRPAGEYDFDWATKTWTPNLERAKSVKWEEMKAARKRALDAPLVTPFGTFDADAESRTFIINTAHLMQTQAQALMPGPVPTVTFTLADNEDITLGAGEMVTVALMLAAQIEGAFERGRELRLQINAATALEEVQAFRWERPAPPIDPVDASIPGDIS